MAKVAFERVRKVYGKNVIVAGFDLAVADGELVVLVGGSGCGKSTTLRMLAGLETVTSGAIRIGERDVTHLAPRERDVAMVFQDYALYPHLSAYENIALGLKLRKVPAAEIAKRVAWASDILGLAPLIDRKPKEMSGGQRQRVAMGRAMVREPAVFLFDEPLSNLDAGLRGQMRVQIAQLQRRLGTTTLYVTHDQVEAMTLADRMVVLDGGHVQQVGRPIEIYRAPANRFVAGFLGSPAMNFVSGAVTRASDGAPVFDAAGGSLRVPLDPARARESARITDGPATLGVRAEDIALAADAPAGHARTDARIVLAERLGATTMLHLEVGSHALVAAIPADRDLRADARLELAIDPARVHLFGPDGAALLAAARER